MKTQPLKDEHKITRKDKLCFIAAGVLFLVHEAIVDWAVPGVVVY